jgi:hypothetical protein
MARSEKYRMCDGHAFPEDLVRRVLKAERFRNGKSFGEVHLSQKLVKAMKNSHQPYLKEGTLRCRGLEQVPAMS